MQFSSIIVRVARGVSHGENGGVPQISAFVAAEGTTGFADTQLSGETATVVKFPEDEIREMSLCEVEKTCHESLDSLEKSTGDDTGCETV